MTPARLLQSRQRMQKKRVHLLFSVHSNCPGLASHWWVNSIQHCKTIFLNLYPKRLAASIKLCSVVKALFLHRIESFEARVLPLCPAEVVAFWRRQSKGKTLEMLPYCSAEISFSSLFKRPKGFSGLPDMGLFFLIQPQGVSPKKAKCCYGGLLLLKQSLQHENQLICALSNATDFVVLWLCQMLWCWEKMNNTTTFLQDGHKNRGQPQRSPSQLRFRSVKEKVFNTAETTLASLTVRIAWTLLITTHSDMFARIWK